MSSVSVCTEVVYISKRSFEKKRSGYEIDFWREVRRRWLVGGVLVALMFAVIAPGPAAPGGFLQTEYTSYIPLAHIYYRAGSQWQRGVSRVRVARVAILGTVIAPALCVVCAYVFERLGMHAPIAKGAVLWSCGAPCGWAGLGLGGCGRGALEALAAAAAGALIVAPFAAAVLCGRPALPSVDLAAGAVCGLALLGGGAAGALGLTGGHGRGAVFSALYLVYCEAGAALSAGRGALPAADLAMAFAFSWQLSTSCIPSGLSVLPAALAAPAHALVLAAITPLGDHDEDEDGDGLPQ